MAENSRTELTPEAGLAVQFLAIEDCLFLKCQTCIYSENRGFDGLDSQNKSHSFPHCPNWNLWIWGTLLIGFIDGSGNCYNEAIA